MSSQHEESVIDFNLDLLQQPYDLAALYVEIKNCRKAVKSVKKRIIATDSLVRRFYAMQAEAEELKKALYSSREECKKICIDYRNISEKYTQLQNENERLRTLHQQQQKKCSNVETLYSALQSHANQLQILIKQHETAIEGLKVEIELEKANNKDYEKKMSSFQKENDTQMKHICLMKEIIFGKRNLNKHYKAILQKYDKGYETDDNDSLFGGMDSDDEIELDSNFKSPLLSKETNKEKKAQCSCTLNQQLQEKCTKAENLYSALQSQANQLQILVKQHETAIEGLKVKYQLEKANNKDYEKKMSSFQKENDILMKHMCLMKEIIFGKRNLNKHYKAILQKYDKGYESDDNDSLFGGMDSDDEIELDSNFKSPLLSKETNKEKVDISSIQISTKTNASKQELIVIKDDNDLDSNFSNEHASADTGRGSSLAFSDGEKCLHSPDYFMDRSPTNAEHTDKIRRDRVDVATSPILFYHFVNTATSPIPAKQAVHIATSPMISHKAKEITVISEPKNNTKGVIHHVSSQCNSLQNVVELQATDVGNEVVNRSTSSMVLDKNHINDNKCNTINKNKSNLSSSSTETNNLLTYNNNIHDLIRVTSPMQLENEILSSDNYSISADIIDERECLELNNCDTFNSTNNKDGEIEMILSKMRFNRDLITPIPTSPFKSHNCSCSMQKQDCVCKDALKSFKANVCKNMKSVMDGLKNKILEIFQDSENDPILILENGIKNFKHDIYSYERLKSSSDILFKDEGEVSHAVSISSERLKSSSDILFEDEGEVPNALSITPERLESSSNIIFEDEGEVPHALSISPKCDFNKSIKRLQFEEPLPPILNEATILDESVDKYANQENTDEEECYEDDIFHVGNFNNNMQSKKRQKQRKLTKLDRFKQKLIPKNKIKPISSPKPKLRMKHLMLSKTKVGASMAAAALNNKSAYEKAVKIMSELKTQQKSKESKLFTLKKRDKQICKEASKILTTIPKVKSPVTKKVDISEEHTFKMQNDNITVNSAATGHMMDMQGAKNTRNTSSLEHKTQEQQITEPKNAKQITILENILLTKVIEKSKLVKPSNTSEDKLPSDLNKNVVVALTNSPELKVIQKEALFGLSPPHENFIKKTVKEKKSLITDAIDSPILGINKTVGTLLTANCLDKVKNSKSVNRKENKTGIIALPNMQQNSYTKTDSIEIHNELVVPVPSKLQQKRELRNSKEINLIACSKTDSIGISKDLAMSISKTPSKLQEKRELRNSKEINLITCSKTDSIGISKDLAMSISKTPSKLQEKRELRNSKEINLIACSKTDSIGISKDLAMSISKTPSKLQEKRELRNSKEINLIACSKTDSIGISKALAIPGAKSPSKLQQKRELRNSKEINLIACSKTDSMGISKDLAINVSKTPLKLQQKRELRNSKEINLIACPKTDSIGISKDLAIHVSKTPSKLQQKRELRNSKEILISITKKDFIEMNKVNTVVKCDEPSMSPSPKKLIATRSITKGVCNLSATFDELKESFATENSKPESIQQKGTPKNEDKNMISIQGTRKRQKTMSLDKPDVECKRMLRSSTLRRTSIQENAKEVASNTSDILLRAERAIKSDGVKEKLQVINLKTEIDQKVQQKAVSYSDIDLFNDNTESNQKIEINKTNAAHPKESILCVMLEKYGRQTVKKISKKIPESVVNIICKTIGNEISEITKFLQNNTRDYKYSMNQFVDTVKKWDFKQFLAGLMQYLKDPQRKTELYNKVSSPQAPPMTNSEQILLFLVKELRQAWPTLNVLECVLCNMEYVLFKLNRTPEFDTVESMSHFYAILCRYFKLKSRLRLFMLDAMYCIQYKSVPLIKQCMEVWMHVLPLAHMGIAKSPMVTCMVYLLHFYKCDDKFKRVQEIRYLLNSKYFYEITEWNETKIIEMFKNAIKDSKAIPVEMKLLRMALIVIAKRHGPKWCQKNIIKNILLPMIENDGYPERVKVFCVSMLGPLLKPYPVDMRVHCEIVMNMLLDMLHQNITPQMEEAIYTSLIFMSRHNYNRVIATLLTWKPSQMSPYLENVMRDFVSEKPLRVWKAILLKISLA